MWEDDSVVVVVVVVVVLVVVEFNQRSDRLPVGGSGNDAPRCV